MTKGRDGRRLEPRKESSDTREEGRENGEREGAALVQEEMTTHIHTLRLNNALTEGAIHRLGGNEQRQDGWKEGRAEAVTITTKTGYLRSGRARTGTGRRLREGDRDREADHRGRESGEWE